VNKENHIEMLNSPVYALITGATRGIGKAIAIRLADAGLNLLLTARDENDLFQLKEELMVQYPEIQVKYLAIDLSKVGEDNRLAQWALAFSPEILINNAAIFHPVSFLDQDDAELAAQWQLNFMSAQTLSKKIGNDMKMRKQGHILMIGSTASRESVQAATYTVTKLALHGLTNMLRGELRNHQVRVTELIPGSTWTSSWEGTSLPESAFMQASDIADAVLYAIQAPSSVMVEEIMIRPPKGNVSSF
jgi:3-oxoacyl-[acyl-carrier protein] reductase